MNRQILYALFICCLIVGSAALFMTVREILRVIAFLRVSHRIDGEIIRFEAYRNSEGSTKHRAVVNFKTPDDRLYEIKADIAYSEPTPAAKTKIRVRYLPASPQNAKIENFWELWETSLFYFLIFFAAVFLGVILFLVAP